MPNIFSRISNCIFVMLVASHIFTASVSAQTNAQVPSSMEQVKLSFSPIVKQTSPAVVNIYTKTLVQRRRRSLFDEMFGNDPFSPFGNSGRTQKRIENSLGSGVFIDGSGIVVTNSHVIKGATEIQVVTSDRREFSAKVMLEIEDADLAFLSLETTEENFPFIALNDSDALEVGDLVLAIGNPFGVGQTVTSGIVSAVSRTGVVQRGNNLFIQTDAAINPGNSGGALVDMSGRLVGINTAIFSRSGGSNGIGFAIPANLIAAYVRDLKTGQASSVPWLGFQGDDLTNDLAREKGLLRAGGVVVDVIFNGGPADKAGINQGDVIVAVNGVEVVDQLSMLYRLRLAEPYSPVTLEVDSGDEISTVLINPIDPPEIPEANTTLLDGNHPFSGMVVSNLSPKAARDRGVAGRWKGVIVDRIYRGSVAGRYGFRVGDILLSLNGKQLTSLDDLDLAALEGRRRWDVKFERNGRVNSLRLFR